MKDKYLHVPYYILTDNNLDSTKKILLSAIKSLSVLEKGCYASNEYFGEILSINSAGASKQISKLKKLGYIETKTFYIASKERRKINVLNNQNPKQQDKKNVFINIPYLILKDKKLDSTQKLIMSEIHTLAGLDDGCFKSNSEFGSLIGVSSNAISKQITKLNEMKYIVTCNVKIGHGVSYRNILLSDSYLTSEVVLEELEGTSQLTSEVIPEELEGTSYRKGINTVYNSIDVFPELVQFTSTENIIDLSDYELKILNSCERGEKLLEQARKNCIDNFWYFGNSNQEVEYLMQIVNEYQDAKKQ